MPKENQKRGRRMKRKNEEDDDDAVAAVAADPAIEPVSKRRKANEDDPAESHNFVPFGLPDDDDISATYPSAEKAFFGMLDDEEQEYFKRADEMLELNSFPTPEERALFLDSVWREADGKELKLAQSQSCSRLLERLIRLSTARQLKHLFQKFSGNFIHLVSHRFASHGCETLFTCAAPFVSAELRKPDASDAADDPAQHNGPDEVYVSMENAFLHTLAELDGNVGFLLTDRYASHALRILLLVLSGKPIFTDSMKSLLSSKRKEGITVNGAPKEVDEQAIKDRPVPKSFSVSLEKLISGSVAGLDTDKLRALVTHPNASPTLQLLLTLELTHYGKQRAKDEHSIIKTLLPDDPITATSESAGFIGGMVYDPIGSHLVERIIECAPAKLFKSLYHGFFKERLASYARNETGTYVNGRILERLSHDDLLEAHEIICPIIPTLLENQWTSLTGTLIERCTVREIDTQPIAMQIDQAFQGPNGFDVKRFLKFDAQTDATAAAADQRPGTNGHSARDGHSDVRTHSTPLPRLRQPAKVHFNILAQAMLIVPGSLCALIVDSLCELDGATLVGMARDAVVSRTLQQALTTRNSAIIQRRKMVQRFYGSIGAMALDTAASHVVDCIWEGTHGLAFIRERIAEELAENETALRESPAGRAVWKNWKMDLYKRKRAAWIRQSKIKASNDGFQSFSELDAKQSSDGLPKTPLQLARERHANKKARQGARDKLEQQQRSLGSSRNVTGSAAASNAPARASTAAAST